MMLYKEALPCSRVLYTVGVNATLFTVALMFEYVDKYLSQS